MNQNLNAKNSVLSKSSLLELHEFALEIADASKILILKLWASGLFGETLKEDKTPVSQVDLQAEALAREMISKKFPSHGIMGEEYEPINQNCDFQWTLDPIDGTQNLINLIPTFGTLIGLRFKGEAVIWVIDHPILNMRTSGGKGLGVSFNKTQVNLTDLKTENLSENDIIATNSPAVFGEANEDQKLFSKVLSFHPHSRIYYDCYDQTLGILGSLAVVVEPNLKIWDITPLEALLLEVGGKCVKFNERNSGAKYVTNAVFGKVKAVDLMCKHLELS